ncbi:MAG TPA: MipA/OmpV family protein [Pseudomonadales bacterium]|nr:MipA/OmpV family protein [Pseudomonadales bacterium]
MKKNYRNKIVVALFSALSAAAVNAEPTEYKIDLGIGLSALQIPHYPGAAQNNHYVLPFPFIRVKSPKLEIERNELSGSLFKNERFKIGITLGGSVPVNSKNDTARKGMPDIDVGMEGGPSFSMILWKPSPEHVLSFDVPVRKAVFFNKEKIDPHGEFALPHLHYTYDVQVDKFRSHSLEIELGAEYASEAYNRYFYDVAPAYATPERPAYGASGGRSAYRFAIGYGTTQKRWYYGAFAKYINLHDSVIADSPLVKQDHSLYAGVAVAYLFDRFSVMF